SGSPRQAARRHALTLRSPRALGPRAHMSQARADGSDRIRRGRRTSRGGGRDDPSATKNRPARARAQGIFLGVFAEDPAGARILTRRDERRASWFDDCTFSRQRRSRRELPVSTAAFPNAPPSPCGLADPPWPRARRGG